MDDLAEAIHSRPDLLFMGGGNPASIPEVTHAFSDATNRLTKDYEMFSAAAAAYSDPAGYTPLRVKLCEILKSFYKWDISVENIMLTNGSQSGFHILFSLLSSGDSSIILPQVPDYIGYADLLGNQKCFFSIPGSYKKIDEYSFRYELNRNSIKDALHTAKLAVISQPTNPTGGLLSQNDYDYLVNVTKQKDTYLLLDQAYGGPFPGIQSRSNRMDFHQHCIYSFSLSKLGFPGGRIGIFVASTEIIQQMVEQLTITSLSPNSIGPAIAVNFFNQDNWNELITKTIQPYYQNNKNFLVNELKSSFSNDEIEYHDPEGAFFLWINFKKYSDSRKLYQLLKDGGLLVVPGDFFYFGVGLEEQSTNTRPCFIRISYTQPLDRIKQSVELLRKVITA